MKEVKAPMAGNVLKIVVSKGDVIEKGDHIVVLETMKMEIHVNSHFSGIVKEIKVSHNDFVNEDEIIAIIE